MQPELIILSEYCIKCNIEPSFVKLLEEEGLINISVKEGKKYLFTSQLSDLERFSRLYYDLSINMEGIGAIHHLLRRVNRLNGELTLLRSRLELYEGRPWHSTPEEAEEMENREE